MASINAMKIPSDPPIAKRTGAVEQQAGGSPADGKSVFSKLFSAMAEKEQSSTENLQGKLQALLGTIQELPKESLTQEEQGIIHEMIQLLITQQEQLKTIPQGIGKSLPSMDNEVHGDLLMSLEKTVKLLQQEVANAVKNAEVAAVDSPSLVIDPEEKPEAILKQLTELVQRLEAEQKMTRQQNRIRMQPEGLNETNDSMSTPEVPLRQETTQNEEGIVRVEGTAKSDPLSDAARVGDSVLASTGTQAETDKTAPPVQRPTTATSMPTMRLAHAADDLLPVLQNSIRLTGAGENSQIKVNIFPEHLGHLDIRLASADGKIAAQIFTSSFAAKEVLDFQVNQLRNALQQQGLDVETIEVSYRDSNGSSEQQNHQTDQRFFRPQKAGAALHGKTGYERIEDLPEKQPGSPESSMKVDYSV